MSDVPRVRRADKVMADDRAREMIARGFCGRLGTVGADGWPYVVPLLYVWIGGEIWAHNTRERGHLRTSVEHANRVCFEIDEPGEVFPYGRYECDTSLEYRSVIAFGRIRIVDDREQKVAFFAALMDKYGDPRWARPPGVLPRLDQVTVYAITVDRMTGKETMLPATTGRWPALDRTKSP